jgi:8-amino-7-oxononanoate synthase
MDGDCPNLEEVDLTKHHCRLVVDEAHALGVFAQGEGFVQIWFKTVFLPVF